MPISDVQARGSRLPRTERRAQLIRAARETFVANGYHGTAMDQIADRAGVSKPVLYQHFSGKHELYLELVEQSATELLQALRTAVRSRPDGVAEAYFDLADSDDAALRLIFDTELTDDPEVRTRVDAVRRGCIELLADAIAERTGLPRASCELLGTAVDGMSRDAARSWRQSSAGLSRQDAVALVGALARHGVAGFDPVR
jgi:AcrR family transcriptional regulator